MSLPSLLVEIFVEKDLCYGNGRNQEKSTPSQNIVFTARCPEHPRSDGIVLKGIVRRVPVSPTAVELCNRPSKAASLINLSVTRITGALIVYGIAQLRGARVVEFILIVAVGLRVCTNRVGTRSVSISVTVDALAQDFVVVHRTVAIVIQPVPAGCRRQAVLFRNSRVNIRVDVITVPFGIKALFRCRIPVPVSVVVDTIRWRPCLLAH